MHKHTAKHNVTVAVAVSTVAVVFVSWCDKEHRKERPGRSVLTDVTRLVWVEQHSHGAKAMGSGTRMTSFCVTCQPTLLIASRKLNPRNR